MNYTDNNGDTRVVEYRSDGQKAVKRVRQLLFVDQPYSNHNGGEVVFGPDGRLYVGMGDGGAGGDPENRAQNPGSRLGKLLALNVNKRGAKWQMVALGLRNPWRFSFDRATGALYMGDVGQGSYEEIDYTPRNSPGLENYGWDVYEGRARFEQKELGPGPAEAADLRLRPRLRLLGHGRVRLPRRRGLVRARPATSSATTARAASGASKVVAGQGARRAAGGVPGRRAVLVRRGCDRRAVHDLARGRASTGSRARRA